MIKKINLYINEWLKKGYNEIPDEVPIVLQNENLAPSWKAIAICILKNDFHCESLGFSNNVESEFYNILKKIELQRVGKIKTIGNKQMDLFN